MYIITNISTINSMRRKTFFFWLIIINISFLPLIAKAQLTTTQSVSLQITGYIDITVPSSLSLPTTFIEPWDTITIYQPYSPAVEAEQIRVLDSRNSGGFNVFLDTENFIKNTVAADPILALGDLLGDILVEVTDSDEYNIGQVIMFDTGEQAKVTNVTGPTTIEVERGFNGTPIAPHLDASGISLIIPYANISIVTLATANSPDTVDTHVNNSPSGTDSQTVFSVLDCDWDFAVDFGTFCENEIPGFTTNSFAGTGIVSNPQTIINGDTPTGIGRAGEYIASLGLRLIVPPGTEYGDYNTVFTFTLIPT